jgi:hypothetical protein
MNPMRFEVQHLATTIAASGPRHKTKTVENSRERQFSTILNFSARVSALIGQGQVFKGELGGAGFRTQQGIQITHQQVRFGYVDPLATLCLFVS